MRVLNLTNATSFFYIPGKIIKIRRQTNSSNNLRKSKAPLPKNYPYLSSLARVWHNHYLYFGFLVRAPKFKQPRPTFLHPHPTPAYQPPVCLVVGATYSLPAPVVGATLLMLVLLVPLPPWSTVGPVARLGRVATLGVGSWVVDGRGKCRLARK